MDVLLLSLILIPMVTGKVTTLNFILSIVFITFRVGEEFSNPSGERENRICTHFDDSSLRDRGAHYLVQFAYFETVLTP